MMRRVFSLFPAVLLSLLCVAAKAQASDETGTTIDAGEPLRIQIRKSIPLARGASVEGFLVAPVYVRERLVLPEGTRVTGIVQDYAPVAFKTRLQARLDGDLTPLHEPIVHFQSLELDGKEIAIDAMATVSTAQPIRFVTAQKRPSLMKQATGYVHGQINDTKDAIFGPGCSDRALQLLFSQLPYHPQRIWSGTRFVADLGRPLMISLPAAASPELSSAAIGPEGISVTARLADRLSSETARKGDVVHAIVTVPVFDDAKHLILAEGDSLDGTVLQAKPSRSFGRNGQLRFVFQTVKPHNREAKPVSAVISSVDGSKSDNLSIDNEGGVKASADKNRFLAPALLGVLAVAGHDRDRDGNGLGRQTVAANGFGVVARVVALTVNDRNVATGFGVYAFAKSIYFRFLSQGHSVEFPRNTQVELKVISRQ
ncbi:hypothetical protein [Terriglobus albidus]|uniref:hypothetical protein n=1 Tax=Terriglobus albidus TaxID=1592106 RepID=UPI0021E02F9A|nr:hypothetical protein [Terriglobus albidus]